MRPRFLLLVSSGDDVPEALIEEIAGRTGLQRAFVRRPIAALVNDGCRSLAVGADSIVLGTLFPCHGPARPLDALEATESVAISETRGDRLITAYWGGYVAAIACGRFVRVLRDPSAALPCYFARRAGLVAFASDADLLIESGFATIEVDWTALVRQLFNAGVPVPATALRGIAELLPGFALGFPAEQEQQVPCWSPWDFVDRRGGNPAERVERLARSVRQCVQGWCGRRGRLLLSVSGGLDSSVVAACLAELGSDTVCLTMYGEDAAGDERAYARALCSHLGLQLVERPDLVDDIDISAPLAAHLPRPFGRTQALSYERAHIDVARAYAAEAFVTGNGGDSVFGYSQSAAAIADRYLVEGLTPGLFGTLRDVSRQTGCSALEALAAAVRIARGPRAYRCRPDPLFLHRHALASLGGAVSGHPWLDAPPGALPGKAAHIGSILRVQHCMEPGRNSVLPVINPLMSQPVMETCLSIPSWEWRAGGRDRSAARLAFAGSLPDVVARRRVKGGPDGFAGQILDRYRREITERLTQGHLAQQGIIDADAIGGLLRGGRPVSGEERVRLFQLLGVEAWLDAWKGRAARARGEGSR